MSLYTTLLFLHVSAAIVWIGGVAALNLVSVRLGREGDPAVTAALGRSGRFFGQRVAGPAAGVTLLAGLAMVAESGMSLATLWIAWGLIGIAASVLMGGLAIRRTGLRLGEAAASDPARVPVLRRRLLRLNVLNVALLFSVVWAMVAKPTL